MLPCTYNIFGFSLQDDRQAFLEVSTSTIREATITTKSFLLVCFQTSALLAQYGFMCQKYIFPIFAGYTSTTSDKYWFKVWPMAEDRILLFADDFTIVQNLKSWLIENRPNAVMQVSDAPAHRLYVLLPPVVSGMAALPQVLAVVQVRH